MVTFLKQHLVSVNVAAEEPQNWELWNSTVLEWEAWLTQDTRISPTCYNVKFGSSETKGKQSPKVRSAGTPPPWGGSVADHLKTIKPFVHIRYYIQHIWLVSVSNSV